eukprot:scaffold273352_cov43-Prasinocladus_malaysianus.AAC.1
MASLRVCSAVTPPTPKHLQPVSEHDWDRDDSSCKPATLAGAFRKLKSDQNDGPKRARNSSDPSADEPRERKPKLGSACPEAKLSPANEVLVKNYGELQHNIETYGLLLAQAIFMARGQRCTFDKLKEPAEKQSGHDVKISHLQQIKHVFPEALEWSWVNSRSGSAIAHPGALPGKVLKVALGPAVQPEIAISSGAIMRRHNPAMQSQAMKASVSELSARLVKLEQNSAGPQFAALPQFQLEDEVDSSQESASDSSPGFSPVIKDHLEGQQRKTNGILCQTSTVQ